MLVVTAMFQTGTLSWSLGNVLILAYISKNITEQFVVDYTRSDRKVTSLTVKMHILSLTISWFGHLQSPLLLTSCQHPSVCAISGNSVGNHFLKAISVLTSHCSECLHWIQN
jgi:hypothetical protein